MKEKSAFGGWFLTWVLSNFMVIYSRAGKLVAALVIGELISQMDGDGDIVYGSFGVRWMGDLYTEKEVYEDLINSLDEIYNMDGVDINFKNTLIVVRKEWATKVE